MDPENASNPVKETSTLRFDGQAASSGCNQTPSALPSQIRVRLFVDKFLCFIKDLVFVAKVFPTRAMQHGYRFLAGPGVWYR
jgi:hypothetical protein